MENKILLTSGCSFTFENWCWPTFVANEINYELLNIGMASQGNGLIAKKTIYNVKKLLETHNPENILVGIMWSGVDRHEIYIDKNVNYKNTDGWDINPTNIIEGDLNKRWLILNHGWKLDEAQLWYNNFHTFIGSMVNTLEYILLTQYFLKQHNIKYFMTTYKFIFEDWLIENVECDYLYNMIDFDKFLPINGCLEWLIENHNQESFNFPEISMHEHPTENGHKIFAKEVILPYLTSNILTN